MTGRSRYLDSFAPHPDAAEIHSITINASPETVYRALWTADLGGAPVIKLLLGLRALPEFVLHGGARGMPRNRKVTLQTVIDSGSGFGILADDPDEIVLGVNGKFWRLTGNLSPFDRDSFEGAAPPGFARAVWNFSIEESDEGTTFSTETRVVCGDAASRRKFLKYWFVVRPFSGLIRRVMLRAVKRACGPVL